MCRRLLGDPGGQYFRDVDLNQWIADAIGEYNQHFSQELSDSIALVTNTHIYSLIVYVATIKDVVRVEYPEGEDPPEYMVRRAYDDPRGFWDGGYYDLRGMGAGAQPAELILGPSPSTGETMRLWYLADYAYPDSDGEQLQAPDRDLNLLAAFVRWRAIVSLESREMASPNLSTNVLGTLGTNSHLARKQFDAMLKSRKVRNPGTVISWDMPRGGDSE